MALKVVYFVLLVLAIVTVMGALPKCQYKNGVPAGISYRGEKHACYASDGVSICGAGVLGFHLYEVEELKTCYKCCPVIMTTESMSMGSPKPTTTARTGNDKTWIIILSVVGAISVAIVVLGLLYKKGCFNASRDEGIGNPGEDLPLPIQISDGNDDDRSKNYVGAA